MSDDLTPQQTEAVRRALRAARHDAPLPADVGARLDATLADLVAERDAADDAALAPVVPLRRRRWPAVLAAAAAVTAIGLAGTQLVDRGGSSSSGDSSALTADKAESAGSAAPSDTDTMTTLGSTALGLTRAQLARLAGAGYTGVDPVGLPATAYCASCYAAADSLKKQPSPAPDQNRSMQDPYVALSARPAGCKASLPPTVGDAPAHLAMHDGQRVLLVVLQDSEGTIARAWPCDGGRPVTIRLD